jgi:hypothetical protein
MFRKLYLLIAVISLTAFPASVLADGSPVILTVYGDIDRSNRGASDKFFDAYLNHHDRVFDRAQVFDLKALNQLKQQRFIADAEGWGNPVALQGPSLEDVLAATGATDKDIIVTAMDGYSVELSAEELKGHRWILALKANEKTLAIGGRGPLWLAYDTQGSKASSDDEAKWVWSVFVIEVN